MGPPGLEIFQAEAEAEAEAEDVVAEPTDTLPDIQVTTEDGELSVEQL